MTLSLQEKSKQTVGCVFTSFSFIMAVCSLWIVLMYAFHVVKGQALHPPKLSVNPLVITDKDSVTIHCQTPSEISVSQCDLHSGSQETLESVSCEWTLTGTQLLQMGQRSLPALLELRCSYSTKHGVIISYSPDSLPSTITINNLVPPELTVNPLQITETDSVTLNCQTPSSLSLTDCYFFIQKQKPSKQFPCLKTLTGTELLLFARQSSPAKVTVTCLYLLSHQSPESSVSTVIIQTPAPELTVNPAVVSETDLLTINCMTPSSFPAAECFLYFRRTKSSTSISCLQTLTGVQLLRMARQGSPAEVQLQCYYTVEPSGGKHQSTLSNNSSIRITLHPPKLSLNPLVITDTDSVTIHCQTPSEISVSQCDLRSGSQEILESVYCEWTLTGTQLLQKGQRSAPALFEVRCSYSIKHGTIVSKSPESLPSTVTINKTTVAATVTLSSSSSSVTTLSPPSTEQWKWMLLVLPLSLGLTVGIFLLGMTFVCAKRRSGDFVEMRMTNHGDTVPAGHAEDNNILSSFPAGSPAGFQQSNRQDSQNPNSDVYHLYNTIPDQPPATALLNGAYSTVQPH